jgi:alpha-glucan,water dikinase
VVVVRPPTPPPPPPPPPPQVGAKSKNLAGLRGRLPASISLPASVTVPFGAFEAALEAPENRDVARQLAEAVALVKRGAGGSNGKSNGNGNGNGRSNGCAAGSGGRQRRRRLQRAACPTARAPCCPPAPTTRRRLPRSNGNGNGNGQHASPTMLLARCRQLAMSVAVPEELKRQLAAAMSAAGIPVPADERRWLEAFNALKGVWASKYNDRAYYSLKKVGLDFDSVRMAVLVQRVVKPQYAFVIHTKNPSNNDEGEVRRGSRGQRRAARRGSRGHACQPARSAPRPASPRRP